MAAPAAPVGGSGARALPDPHSFELVADKHSRDRGGSSKVLTLFCGNCSTYVMSYQKDGPGKLLRCYRDRILAIEGELPAAFTEATLAKAPPLACSVCKAKLAIPMIYTGYGERRPAYNIIKGMLY